MSRIIVKNLPQNGVIEEDLKKHFADIDNVTDIKLKFNDFGAFRRFAFVGFKSEEGATKAINKLNNSFIRNSKIAIEACKAIRDRRQEKTPKISPESNGDNFGDGSQRHQNKKANTSKENPFEDLHGEPEFEEFVTLQRNLGQNIKTKQIWSDDAGIPKVVSQEETAGQQSTETTQPKKRHHRSRPKKKSLKTKPKEIFEHTVKMKGFPETARRKDIIDFLKPIQLLSVRLNKKDGLCYASFKDEHDLKFALRKNNHFWTMHRIKMMRHDIKRSRLFKENVQVKCEEKKLLHQKQMETIDKAEPIEESGRLFVRNLNYNCTQDDLEQVFKEYGELTEVHIPIDKKTSMPKGCAYVEFQFPQNAKRAYDELNGTIFQGRNFHILPSEPKPEQRANINASLPVERPPRQPAQSGATSTFKKEKQQEQKQTAPRASNWNILFLGQNALADVVSEARGVDKSKLLTQQTRKEPIAVRMALGDATVVEEMRNFLISNGIELDSFDNAQAPRSKTVMIVKNLPKSTQKDELEQLFSRSGRVSRIIMPPNGLTAIVEMDEPVEAKLAFRKLAYFKFKDSLLYLEWAPINVFREKSAEEQDQEETEQLMKVQTGTKILVKNVPFEGTPEELKKIFAAHGELNFVRLPKKMDGSHRGFGFVDYLTREDALRAFRALGHSTHLYGRKLVLEWAKSDDQQQKS